MAGPVVAGWPNGYLLARYVAWHVAVAVCATLFVFTAATLVLSILDELNGAVGLARATWYALLGVPRRIHELTPFVAMLGALAGLSGMAGNAELTAARAAGASVYRLAAAALLPTLVLALFSGLLAETLAPWGEREAEVARATFREGQGADVGRGYWYRDGTAFVSVDAVAADGSLRGMTTLRFSRRGDVVDMQFARRARFTPDGWRMEDVNETHLDGRRALTKKYVSVLWPSAVTPALLSTRVMIAPTKLSVRQLAEQVNYMQREQLDGSVYELALWRKLLQPIALLALVMLATSFVFGPLRGVGTGTRLTIGAFVGLAFKYLQDLAAPIGLLLGVHPGIAAMLPIALTLSIGGWLLRRAA